MAKFRRAIRVRFAHCDAAGWVFYPRYFEMVSDFVEDWFAAGLGTSAPELLHRQAILTPSVHFTADFLKPARFGDRLQFTLAVRRIGRSSCELEIDASLEGVTRMRMRQVVVLISASTGRATAIPAPLVTRMQKYLVGGRSRSSPRGAGVAGARPRRGAANPRRGAGSTRRAGHGSGRAGP